MKEPQERPLDLLKIVADDRIPIGWIWFKSPPRSELQRIVEQALQRKGTA